MRLSVDVLQITVIMGFINPKRGPQFIGIAASQDVLIGALTSLDLTPAAPQAALYKDALLAPLRNGDGVSSSYSPMVPYYNEYVGCISTEAITEALLSELLHFLDSKFLSVIYLVWHF